MGGLRLARNLVRVRMTSMKSLQGHLLVAAPTLSDPNFLRTVVLLVMHEADGAFGLVLNRPTETTVKELWKALEETRCARREPLFWGGPVSNRLIVLHEAASDAEDMALPGVFVSVKQESLRKLMRKTSGRMRVFNGYAGWSAGQLETELADGGWLLFPASADLTFFDPEQIWEHSLQLIGTQILRPLLGKSPLPPDPSVN